MEQLRLEYLAREERFMLDGDRNELKTIKQELDELRLVTCCHFAIYSQHEGGGALRDSPSLQLVSCAVSRGRLSRRRNN